MTAFVTVTTVLFVAFILQSPKGVSSNLWCYQCRNVSEATESCNELRPCNGNATLCFASFNKVTKLRRYGCISATVALAITEEQDNSLRICRAKSRNNHDLKYCACDSDCCNTWTERFKGGPNENGCPTTTSATFNSTAFTSTIVQSKTTTTVRKSAITNFKSTTAVTSAKENPKAVTSAPQKTTKGLELETTTRSMDKKHEKLKSGAAKPKQKLLLISVIVLAATLLVAPGS